MQYKKVNYVIFDMDGLILDTESLYTLATNNVTSKYGKLYTWEHKMQIMGCSFQDAAKFIVETLDLPLTIDEYCKLTKEQHEILMAHPKLMPGAEKLIKHLHQNNIPIAVATSSSREGLALKTEDHQKLFALFNHLVSGSSDPEVKSSKPAPDIFLVCASKFPCDPSECLVFEDAPNGVEAALAAGMQVAMVPDPRVPDEIKQKATVCLNSLEEFKPEEFGLPAFLKD